MRTAGIGSNWRKIELLQSTPRSERAGSHMISTATACKLQIKVAQLASGGKPPVLRDRQNTLSLLAKMQWKLHLERHAFCNKNVPRLCRQSHQLFPSAPKSASGMDDALKSLTASATVRHQILQDAPGLPYLHSCTERHHICSGQWRASNLCEQQCVRYSTQF